jgi:bifunctional DNA-binding transcriptional regulator/antitoxin component of YhaV-PrlF toxin-antitoxin module
MARLRLIPIGTATGLVIPGEMLTRMQVREGDTLYVVETADGYHIYPVDLETEKQVAIAREGMGLFNETLKRLAK